MKISEKCYPIFLTLSTLIIFSKSKKPYGKRQFEMWRVECELGITTDPDCPIDGSWASWNPWSACFGLCDSIGFRRRTRDCINPSPSNDGSPCYGPDQQTESCYISNCTINDYRKLAQNDTIKYEAWRQLEAEPALMERCLQTDCTYDAVVNGLILDNTWQMKSDDFWNALYCVKRNIGCPIIGEWGTWGNWSDCGARCGQGIRWTTRKCDSPPPSDASLLCVGSPLNMDTCEGNQCAIQVQDIRLDDNGTWSEWSEWSFCSENCGKGIRRRHRVCQELDTYHDFVLWGTHCIGQHDQLEVCENEKCLLDGNWSGWSIWGPCTQTCGAGRRFRARTCTRPIPAGGGKACMGEKTETEPCHLLPCQAYSHTIAKFNGDSSLEYRLENKRSNLLHFYIRFMPLSAHGILVRRGPSQNPLVRLSLQKWRICLDVSSLSKSCHIRQICSLSPLEPETWHSAMITVTHVGTVLRLDDAMVPLKATFSCEPDLPNEKMKIIVGEKFHGEIQELILNFIPLNMFISRDRNFKQNDFFPTSTSNIAYEKANIKEAFIKLDSHQYLRVPCFDNQDEWHLELTVKSEKDTGTIIILSDNRDNYMHLALHNSKIKLKLFSDKSRSESTSATDFLPGKWIDITLSKKKYTNTIEATANGVERLHVVFGEITARKRRESFRTSISDNLSQVLKTKRNIKVNNAIEQTKQISYEPVVMSICTDEFYVGGLPSDLRNHDSDEFNAFIGQIASLSVDNVLHDLHMSCRERHKDGRLQISSRTASVSGSYHETGWGKSNQLNLTCLHARNRKFPNAASWLLLDVTVSETLKVKNLRSIDDGHLLRLVATANNDLRGFYTCRSHSNKKTRNVVTYGVVGKIQYKLNSPDATTAIALITTLTLVISTLAWLVIEGINDLRNGYGFFRDRHLSPEEEAQAVCDYIDKHMNLVGSKKVANIAKEIARRKGRRLASRYNVAAQEPQGMMKLHNYNPLFIDTSHNHEPLVPALPSITSTAEDCTSPELFVFDQSFISSPRHGSYMSSPRAELTSTPMDKTGSPRFLCSRLLLTRLMSSPRSNTSRKQKSSHKKKDDVGPKTRLSNLLTIKSSSRLNLSPAEKILQKFKLLKSTD